MRFCQFLEGGGMVLDALLEFQQFVFRLVGGDQLIDLDQNMSGMDLLNDLPAGGTSLFRSCGRGALVKDFQDMETVGTLDDARQVARIESGKSFHEYLGEAVCTACHTARDIAFPLQKRSGG